MLTGGVRFSNVVNDSRSIARHYFDFDPRGATLGEYTQRPTKDVLPIACHSHNDYRRNVPLFDALHAGCISVEADIWPAAEATELLVGHHRRSLSHERTLRSLYLNPIADLLNST